MTTKRSISGLRPCPFCGGVSLSLISHRGEETKAARFLTLQCNDCGATGPFPSELTPFEKSKEEVRMRWDTRAEEQ